MTRKPGRDPSVQSSRSRYGASYPHPILKYWCALNTRSPGQSRGRAGASLLTASPTVPACRPAYAAATCHWATRDRHPGARFFLCNIAHAHPYPQGFVSFGLNRLSPIGTQTNGPGQSLALVVDRSWACLPSRLCRAQPDFLEFFSRNSLRWKYSARRLQTGARLSLSHRRL